LKRGDLMDILHDLDGFVESDIGFDELTEFIVDAAVVTRARPDLTVSDALRSAMEGYRATSAERHAQYGEAGPSIDPVREGMARGHQRPRTPGELLREEFLVPMGISQYRLAKEIGVPAQRIGEIVAGRRSITADTDLRLCRYFGLSDGYWLRAQVAHDTEVARERLAGELDRIRPWSGTAT
jgi:addiction module HigA family antidote